MYAIIQTGSKQYRVAEGDIIDVELLAQAPSESVEFEDILLVHTGTDVKVGAPRVEGVSVKGEVISIVKGPKVIAFKYKRRKKCRRKIGHRQHYARVKIVKIAG